ncbi:MAG: trehalase family glycosidase [Candidatus Saccharimonadales bacterium]
MNFTLGILDKNTTSINPKELERAIDYINDYWDKLIVRQEKTTTTLFGLPNPYVVPSKNEDNFQFNEQYYWDSFFISIGLIESGKNDLAEGMLENLFYMFECFKMIPNANRFYMTGRSQPPILTSYIDLIFKSNNKNKAWLKRAFKIAEKEYWNVWRSSVHPHWREVYKGLSRYYDINDLHDLAEAESGWDMTPRFERKTLDFLPIDLNCLLYKYEIDFAKFSDILGNKKSQRKWLKKAELRRKTVNELMWNRSKNFFFDYNFINKNQNSVWSLASFYAMWTGLADEEQARQMVKNLDKFTYEGGVSTTTRDIFNVNLFGSHSTQWAYPNGWAPLHFIVIEGLKNYGYDKQAKELTSKWLKTNLTWFNAHGEFLEKYNIVNPEKPPINGVYPSQTGFGWTNAIFLYLAKRYIKE